MPRLLDVWMVRPGRVFLLSACAALLMTAQTSTTPTGSGVTLSSNKLTYAPGEPIRLMFEVFHHSSETVLLQFTSSQRYDFVAIDEQHKEVWRWSAKRMFAAVMGTESLGLGKPSLRYQESCETKLPPGAYEVTARLTDEQWRPSATIRVLVK